MADIFRDAPVGQMIRWVTGNRMLQYPEERSDFELPASYRHAGEKSQTGASAPASAPITSPPAAASRESIDSKELSRPRPESTVAPELAELKDLEKAETEHSQEHLPTMPRTQTGRSTRSHMSRVSSRGALGRAATQEELKQEMAEAALNKTASQPIEPQVTADGVILVDWYTTDDPDNPQNWSFGKKMLIGGLICLYTLAVYMGSAIYTPSETGVMKEFGVSIEVAELGLALYVLAYGTGPLIWSPLSEVPAIGRNPVYMVTFAIFTILIVPTALVKNIAGLLILRFLLGFFGSPCLATGGASLQDMFSLVKLPYVIAMWAFAATCGPALGPTISGFSVPVEGWRWSSWEMLWLAGPILILFLTVVPETSTPNILLRRAQRLRKITGNDRYRSQSEIDQANMVPRQVIVEALWRPIQLIVLDPSIFFTAIYTALIYGTYYSFFEAFPLVYLEIYHFNIGQMGLTFLSITIGVILAIAAYWTYVYLVLEPRWKSQGLGDPEKNLIPALYATLLCPIGLFIFAWTSRSDITWVASVIGILVFTFGVFIVIQCIFLYLPFVYPQYAASLFAGNDFARSSLATGAIMFGRPLYINLGIGNGVSLLGALCAACCAGVYILFFFGHKLRARSRFSAK